MLCRIIRCYLIRRPRHSQPWLVHKQGRNKRISEHDDALILRELPHNEQISSSVRGREISSVHNYLEKGVGPVAEDYHSARHNQVRGQGSDRHHFY